MIYAYVTRKHKVIGKIISTFSVLHVISTQFVSLFILLYEPQMEQ